MPLSRLTPLAVLSVLCAVVAIAPATPAHAGDLGRQCHTFYAQGNPASGWGFTICVKLQHDPATHTWRATASNSTTTPGIRQLTVAVIYMIDNEQPRRGADTARPPETQASAATLEDICDGTHTFEAYAGGSVIWPNGVVSDFVGPIYACTRRVAPGVECPVTLRGNC